MKYVCPEPLCSYEGIGRYTTELRGELCVDMNNIASIFCPHCQNVLMPEEETLISEEESAM